MTDKNHSISLSPVAVQRFSAERFFLLVESIARELRQSSRAKLAELLQHRFGITMSSANEKRQGAKVRARIISVAEHSVTKAACMVIFYHYNGRILLSLESVRPSVMSSIYFGTHEWERFWIDVQEYDNCY